MKTQALSPESLKKKLGRTKVPLRLRFVEDGRPKIPLRFAKHLDPPVNKSSLVRVNQGKRNLSEANAMQVVDLFGGEGIEVHILEILPRLKKLIPYICRGCEHCSHK